MTEKHMQHLLQTRSGIGVEVKTANGFIVYYFYEDFDGPETGIQRAMKQLYPDMESGKIEKLKFIAYSK